MSDIATKDVTTRKPKAEVDTSDNGSRNGAAPREAQLRWDDSKMTTNFANAVNIQTTREEVDLFFGTNQTWNLSNDTTLAITLSNRIILTPFASKRLMTALSGVLREYEARYGEIKI